MRTARSKVAVVVFNLGGPDGPGSVRPFLENLFSDRAIIDLPWIARRPLAAAIARLRESSAIANYARMGGGSPLLPETQAQADALEAALNSASPDREFKVFIAMRYWRPNSAEAAKAVAAYAPDDVVLAPLYPQFSTTTTASSVAAWRRVYRGPGIPISGRSRRPARASPRPWAKGGTGRSAIRAGWVRCGGSGLRRRRP
jgi:ferrochelatase